MKKKDRHVFKKFKAFEDKLSEILPIIRMVLSNFNDVRITLDAKDGQIEQKKIEIIREILEQIGSDYSEV